MLLLFQLKAKDNGYPITTASLCLPGNVLRQDKFSTSYIVYKIRYIVFTTYFNWFISLEIFFTFPSSTTIIDITVYCIENEWLSLYENQEIIVYTLCWWFRIRSKTIYGCLHVEKIRLSIIYLSKYCICTCIVVTHVLFTQYLSTYTYFIKGLSL